MSELERWEEDVRAAAGELDYPPTPDVAPAVTHRLRGEPSVRPWHRRPLAQTALVLLLALIVLMGVPTVRAAVLEIIRVGSVQIIPTAPTAAGTSVSSPTATSPVATALGTASPRPTQTDTPQPTPTAAQLASVLDLQGEMTLVEARHRLDFPVRLPRSPEDLGEPDRVFVQEFGGQIAVLVWLEPGEEGRSRLVLYEMGRGVLGQKFQPEVLRETRVGGKVAYWGEGEHLFWILRGGPGRPDHSRVVDSNVLIWQEDGITYRLESDLDMEESVRIAESLR